MRRTLIGLVVAVALVAGGAAAYAAIPSSTGVISACYNTTNGNIRVVDTGEACKSSEKKLTWNQKGEPGTPGTPGAPGAPGQPGKDGADGINGVSGYEIVHRTDDFTFTSFGGNSLNTSAVCPTGKVAVGGGGEGFLRLVGEPFFANQIVVASFPSPDGRGWQSDFSRNADRAVFAEGQTLRYHVYAVCVNALP